MGSIIGKAGAKIKSIHDTSRARVVAHKEMLPQSTERVVEISGTSEQIGIAIKMVAECVHEDGERAVGTVLFHPGAIGPDGPASAIGQAHAGAYNGQISVLNSPISPQSSPFYSNNNGSSPRGRGDGRRSLSYGTPRGGSPAQNGSPQQRRVSQPYGNGSPARQQPHQPMMTSNLTSPQQNPYASAGPLRGENEANLRTQNIAFPADMIGCIIVSRR